MQTTPAEPLFPIVDAVEAATGRRPHLSTVLRWCQRGARGVRLESKVLGGRRLCSVQAVLRFVDTTTRASEIPDPPSVASPSVQEARHQRAKARLEAALNN